MVALNRNGALEGAANCSLILPRPVMHHRVGPVTFELNTAGHRIGSRRFS